MAVEVGRAGASPGRFRLVGLLGPAFVAAIAYVDPGNVAANLTAGARYGYLLVWVLVAANATAVLVQYLSAKLGLVTGASLPEVLAARLGRRGRLLFGLQAEVVAIATDVAELIGGAVALHLLLGMPLVAGGLVVGVVSTALLALQSRRGQRAFEAAVVGLLAVVSVGFTAGLVAHGADWPAAAGGLVPRFEGTGSVLLAAGMLGATVMPHAIYLHSALARDRHGRQRGAALERLLRATRLDVLLALLLAGAVNIAMLLLAAGSLAGRPGTDTIEGAHASILAALGPVVAAAFAVGLLASGLASTSVGSYAGAVVLQGFLQVRMPLLVQRAITLVPGLAILAAGVDPTWALVLSQVVLSFGIPFALVPLVLLTGSRTLMGPHRNRPLVAVLAWAAAGAVVALNVTLIGLTAVG